MVCNICHSKRIRPHTFNVAHLPCNCLYTQVLSPTDCTISFITPTSFGCKPLPFSGNYKCCQHINITFHSWSALRLFQSGNSSVLNSGKKSSVTGSLGTTLYVVLLYRVCCNFKTIFITLCIYGRYQYVLTFYNVCLNNLCSTLYVPSTSVAP